MSDAVLKVEAKALIKELLSLTATESREDEISSRLRQICPDPAWSNWIFYSNEYIRPDGGTDVDAVVEKIFSYKAIQL